MSGVEIAGLILGAIPLMISALEHYRETAEVLEGWWKVKSEWRKCKNALNYHKVAFEENLEELLLPLIADEDKLKRLLDCPGGPEWKDSALEEMLKQRMPKTYSSYLDTIQEMEEVLRRLNDALGVNKTHFRSRVSEENHIEKTTSKNGAKQVSHVTILSIATIEYQAQRIKLALNKTTRQELFEEFGMYNARLRDILGSSDRLAALRQNRVSTKSTAASSGLWKFWTHANSVFDLLTDAFSCQCQALHHTNLLLQHRESPPVHFRVVFWYKSHLNGGQLPWTWQDTTIKLLENIPMPVILKVPTLQNIPPKSIMPPASQPKTPAAVGNAILNAEDNQTASQAFQKSFFGKWKYQKYQKWYGKNGSMHTAVAAPLPPTKLPATPPNTLNTPSKPKVAFMDPSPPTSTETPATPTITNLCTTIANSQPKVPYGCMIKDNNQYLIQPIHKTSNDAQTHVSLDTLLNKSSPITLSRRQRYHIALILASSLIQLHPTPWLTSRWSKKDIFFLHSSSDHTTVAAEQPYVSRPLSKAINHPPALSHADAYIFQDSLRNLGIMLLELCFGTAIEDHKMRRNLNAEDEQSLMLINYAVAIQWVREVADETGPEFADAVTWCLHNVPESGREERWREDMYAGVVEKLKSCYDQLLGV